MLDHYCWGPGPCLAIGTFTQSSFLLAPCILSLLLICQNCFPPETPNRVKTLENRLMHLVAIFQEPTLSYFWCDIKHTHSSCLHLFDKMYAGIINPLTLFFQDLAEVMCVYLLF